MDNYPGETSWSFVELQESGSDIMIQQESGYNVYYATYEYDWCVPADGCYKFTINDSYGDGFLSGPGYNLSVDGVEVMSYDGEGYGESISFGSMCPTLNPTSSPSTTQPSLSNNPTMEVNWTYFMGKGYPNETPVISNEELMTMLPGIPFTVRRLCPNCLPSHQDIYYRRLTPLPEGFNLLDTLMNNWFSQSNLLNEDFSLHSTYEDAVLGVNGWEICNYDDPGVGFPRDCGPKELIGAQWNSYYYYRDNPVTDVHAFYYD
jgi:hypothetical protein